MGMRDLLAIEVTNDNITRDLEREEENRGDLSHDTTASGPLIGRLRMEWKESTRCV